jgi:hypothetical protein
LRTFCGLGHGRLANPRHLAGRLHHIGVGRTYTGTRILILVQDLNIKIINAATGELLRQLTLDPTRDYQPTGAPKGPKVRNCQNLLIRERCADWHGHLVKTGPRVGLSTGSVRGRSARRSLEPAG